MGNTKYKYGYGVFHCVSLYPPKPSELRLENILFGSKFTESPTKPNEFLIDNSLKQKIKDWAPTFASYLIHLYVNEYKKLQCLIAPKEVKLSTESYIAENDFTSDYVLNRLVYTGDKSDSLGINVMYEDFKGWYKNSRDGNSKAPSRNEFQKLLIDKIGEGNSGKWRGFTFNIETSINKDSDSDNEKSALDI